MLRIGQPAPDFMLIDHHGMPFRLRDFQDRSQVLISFVPAAFTPICSTEVPALDALAQRFVDEAKTAVVVVTPDNVPSNAAWARQLGVTHVRLLADWKQHGQVSQRYDAWLRQDDVCDRASVLVGLDGRIKWAESVGKFGKRSAPAMLQIATLAGGRKPLAAGVSARMAMDLPAVYATTTCEHCAAVEAFLDHTALGQRVVVRHVDQDKIAMRELLALDPDGAVPTLVQNGRIVATGDASVERALRATFGVR